MLQNAYLLAKIGADTAENERHFAEILPKIGNYPTGAARGDLPPAGAGAGAAADFAEGEAPEGRQRCVSIGKKTHSSQQIPLNTFSFAFVFGKVAKRRNDLNVFETWCTLMNYM